MARIKITLSAVCDAGPILHLDELDCLHLLEDFKRILIPDTVRTEVLKHRAIDFETVRNIQWIVTSQPLALQEPLRTMCRVFALDAGEVAALSILNQYPEFVFLTDDAAARLVADNSDFRVHGTLGILIRFIRTGRLSSEAVIDILKDLSSKSTLHIKASLLDEVLLRVKNAPTP